MYYIDFQILCSYTVVEIIRKVLAFHPVSSRLRRPHVINDLKVIK